MSTPPPAERSLNKQLVLDEDEYTSALSKIIARDFFPSLVHLDATNEYLDAVHSNDPKLINASVRRLEEISATPTTNRRTWQTSQTPYGGGPLDTPLRTPRPNRDSSLPPPKRARYDTDMSLDSFQAKYTSEDNSSFTQILDEENRKRRERYGWAWDAQNRVERTRDRMLEGRERMLIEAPSSTAGVREKFLIEAPKPAGLITDGRESEQALVEGMASREDDQSEAEVENSLAMANELARSMGIGTMAVWNGKDKEQTTEITEDVMAPKKDARSAGVDGWNFKARNSLMFAPDADVSPYHPAPSRPEKETDPKFIKHGNTRLGQDEYTTSTSQTLSEPPSPTRSRIDAAISGTPYRPSSPTRSTSSLVPNLPSPTASQLGPAAVKQLMTWGTLTSTPRIISSTGDDPADLERLIPNTPFRIPEPSARERISHKLSNDASKSLRNRAGLLGLGGTPRAASVGTQGKGGAMLPPSWTPRRAEAAGNLTPAARNLLNRTALGAVAARRLESQANASGKEKDLNRVRWTPSPSPRRGGGI